MSECDRHDDLMSFLMTANVGMPTAPFDLGPPHGTPSSAASRTPTSLGSQRSLSSRGLEHTGQEQSRGDCRRQLSFSEPKDPEVGGDNDCYRRGATVDSNMGLTPPCKKNPAEAPLFLKASSGDEADAETQNKVLQEIYEVADKLEVELKLEENKNKEKATKDPEIQVNPEEDGTQDPASTPKPGPNKDAKKKKKKKDWLPPISATASTLEFALSIRK